MAETDKIGTLVEKAFCAGWDLACSEGADAFMIFEVAGEPMPAIDEQKQREAFIKWLADASD